MALDFNNDLTKKAPPGIGTDIRIHRTIYTRSTDGGGETSSGPGPGESIAGGGVVTGITATDATTMTAVDFPDGSMPEHPDAPTSSTDVMMKFGPTSAQDPGGGIYINGHGPTVGQELSDGGVVTGVGSDFVDIFYANGAPQGPIEVPWVDTTIIRESSGVTNDDDLLQPGFLVSLDGGLSLDDLKIPNQSGGSGPAPQPPRITAAIPNPGGLGRSLRLSKQTLNDFTNSPSSVSDVWIAFIDAHGKTVGEAIILPPNSPARDIVPPRTTKTIVIMTSPQNTTPGTVVVSWVVSAP